MDMLCSMKSPNIEIRSRNPSSPRSSSAQYADLDSPTSGSGPRCWDDQLQDISEGLQLICGSPMLSPRSPTVPTSSDSPNFPSPSSPTSPLCNVAVDTPVSTFVRQEMRRATSVNNPVTNPSRRPMTVRHIETSKQLTQQLSAICGTKPGSLNDDATDDNDAKDVESSTARGDSSPPASDASATASSESGESAVAPHPPVSYRAAALMAAGARLRLKVDVRSAMLEDLIVSVGGAGVGDRKILTVRTTHGCSKILLRTFLPDAVEINRLLCYVHGRMLLIHERPEERAQLTYVGTGCVYLPVVRENEIRKELTIVLHVPESFEFKNLTVKTVDDTVIFSGVRDVKIQSAPPQTAMFSFDSSASLDSAAQPPPSFQVTMPLPNGVDSRSVTACLAKHNQVIVKGRVCPTSRSCTM